MRMRANVFTEKVDVDDDINNYHSGGGGSGDNDVIKDHDHSIHHSSDSDVCIHTRSYILWNWIALVHLAMDILSRWGRAFHTFTGEHMYIPTYIYRYSLLLTILWANEIWKIRFVSTPFEIHHTFKLEKTGSVFVFPHKIWTKFPLHFSMTNIVFWST